MISVPAAEILREVVTRTPEELDMSPLSTGTVAPSVVQPSTTIRAIFKQGEFLLADGTYLRDVGDVPKMLDMMGYVIFISTPVVLLCSCSEQSC